LLQKDPYLKFEEVITNHRTCGKEDNIR